MIKTRPSTPSTISKLKSKSSNSGRLRVQAAGQSVQPQAEIRQLRLNHVNYFNKGAFIHKRPLD